MEGTVGVVSEDFLREVGKVDEGVPVVLELIDGVVAADFFLAHRVLSRPLEQQLFRPRLEVAPAEVGLGLHAEVFVHVADRHVEVGAGEIAFEIVDRLEHLAGIAGDVGGAHFAAVGAGPGRVGHLAEGQVAAFGVDIAVGGDEVEEVGVHRGHAAAEPAFGHGMLSVVAVAFD